MEEKQSILLCEDDENLGMLLREYLQKDTALNFAQMAMPDIKPFSKANSIFACWM